MSKFHVEQIASFLEDEFAAEYARPDLDEVNNRSRYLARYSLDLAFGEGLQPVNRILEITDGSKDRGIDAIAVDPAEKVVVFSQSKWRQSGAGGFDLAEMLKFVEGVRSLVGARSESEPVHASEGLRSAVRELLKTPSARIVLVTATTGNAALAQEVRAPLDALLLEMNDLEGVDPIASYKHFGQAELFKSLTSESVRNVDLDVNLLNWGGGSGDEHRIFYGKVSGADIARWHEEFGDELFAENIRVVIPRSDINTGIAATVRDTPEKFGYYNNGITILAENIAHGPGGMLNRDVIHLGLSKASVVNGAQTVSTLRTLLGTEWEQNLGQVFVLTRCVEVPADDPTVARGITRYLNTQNEVSSQDFAYLDEEQHRLARELRTLGVEYVIRQSEQLHTGEMTVVYLRDAAIALACASGDVGLVVTAKREVSRLFTQNGSEYKRLFNAATDPVLLDRAVRVLSAVDESLDVYSDSASGVELGVAIHGRLVIASLVMERLGRENLSDSTWSLADAIVEARATAVSIAERMSDAFPANAYPGNVFKNRARTAELIEAANAE